MVMDPLVVENSLQCLWAGTQQQLEAETKSTVGDGVPRQRGQGPPKKNPKIPRERDPQGTKSSNVEPLT